MEQKKKTNEKRVRVRMKSAERERERDPHRNKNVFMWNILFSLCIDCILFIYLLCVVWWHCIGSISYSSTSNVVCGITAHLFSVAFFPFFALASRLPSPFGVKSIWRFAHRTFLKKYIDISIRRCSALNTLRYPEIYTINIYKLPMPTLFTIRFGC